MKLVLIAACIISLAFIACNGNDDHQKEKPADSAAAPAVTPVRRDTVASASNGKDSAEKKAASVENGLKDKILGIWAFVGDENATFVIKKDRITYPDHNASYKYVLKNDSIHIKFDGFVGNYLVQTRGSDTLVLVGDDQQVYYRFSK